MEVTYAGADACGNDISELCIVNVTGAGPATITCPVVTITCDEVAGFTPAAASFDGMCDNTGTIAGIVTAPYTGCQDGIMEVTYAGADACGNDISELCIVNVTGAGPATITCPVATITCDEVAGFTPAAASFDGMCDNTGTICLLYTSPSPRDRTRSRMPSSA